MKEAVKTHMVSFLLVVCNLSPGLGQSSDVDSLKKILDNSGEAEKIGMYLELSRLHLGTSLEAALRFAEDALELSEKLNDKKGKADALNRKGNVYYYFADYEKSLGYYLESLALREEIGDKEGIAGSYSNIGLIYSDFGDHEKAIEYTLEAYSIFVELGDQQRMGVCLNNLTYFNLLLRNLPEALDYGMQTLNIYQELDDRKGISDALNNLGDIFKEGGRYDEALTYHIRSLELNLELNNLHGIANSKYNIAQLYLELSDLDKAFRYLSESLPLAEEVQVNDLIMKICSLMATCYQMKQDFVNALKYHQLYCQVVDSIFNQESSDRINTMQVRFEAESKSREIRLLKQDQEILELKKKKQKNLIIYLILASSLILILGIVGFICYRVKAGTNEMLREQNITFYYANQNLRKSEKNLREMNTTKDKFFSIIGHDLINPFQALIGLAELLHDHSEELDNEEILKYSQLINLSAVNLSTLVENLIQWTSAQTGRVKYEPTDLRLSEQAEDIINLMSASAEKKGIKLVTQVDRSANIFADKNILDTVLRNLVGNAIKYTYPGGQITIRSRKKRDRIIIEVADNGTGIAENNLKNLFNLEKTFSTRGTSEEEGSGLGLILCKEFVELNGGEIWAHSVPGQGSTFSFTVPFKS